MKRRGLVASLVTIVTVAVVGVVATLLAGWSPQLGLDLQGGASVVLQPEGDVRQGTLDAAVDIIRNRVDGLGVAEPEVTRNGDTIVVALPGVKDQDRALEIVGQTAELRFRYVLQELGPPSTEPATTTTVAGATTVPGETTVAGATTVPGETTVAGATTVPGATTAPAAPSTTGAATTVAGDALGAAGPGEALPLPAQTPDTTMPATTAPATTAAPGATTVPGETLPGATTLPPATTVPPPVLDESGITPPDQDLANAQVVLPEKDGSEILNRYLLGPTFLLGDAVDSAQARLDQSGTEWRVEVNLKDSGAAAFDAAAQQCYSGASAECPPTGLGDDGSTRGRIAIVLDGVVQSAPTVNAPVFDGEVVISGRFSEREAKNLALVLRYGSLPVKLVPQEVRTVSASLGKDSLNAGIAAGLIGMALVLAFMIFYYRWLGLVVLGGLCVSTALLWTVISWLGETRGLAFTLAGATGIIVSIGITVDSYVVYFERLKDEIRGGRTLRGSAERGFKSAYRTIVAADLVSLIGAALLWYLTVGSVRGFAFFLGLSALLDMVVAYMFTRPVVILLARSSWLRNREVLGVHSGEALALAGGTR